MHSIHRFDQHGVIALASQAAVIIGQVVYIERNGSAKAQAVSR
jgi:hypothetical protein